MVLSNGPEVIGLRRRMSANGVKTLNRCNGEAAPGPVVSERRSDRAYDKVRETTVVADEDVGDLSDGMSRSCSSDLTSSGSSKSDATEPEPEAEAAERRGSDDAEGSSETLTPKSRGFKLHPAPIYRSKATARQNTATSNPSSWFTYDLSIVVALVSPIGQWLTGGDHVKNLLLVMLLIFYLHQLIEVPWTLYRMSIPPQRSSKSKSSDPTPAQAQLEAAHHELRSLELLYLALTVLSPFLGATLLRTISSAVTGSDHTLSWFSTTLFVLATGLRPWSHLVDRLRGRSTALKEVLIEGGTSREENNEDLEVDLARFDETLGELREHVQQIEAQLNRVGSRNKDEGKKMYERMQEVVEGVEKAIRRQQKQITKVVTSQEARLAALESQLGGLRLVKETAPNGQVNVVSQSVSSTQQWLCWLFRLPSVQIEQAVANGHGHGHARRSHSHSARSPTHDKKSPKHKSSSESLNSHRHGPHLDPIPEEGTPMVHELRPLSPRERHRSTPSSPSQQHAHPIPVTPRLSPVQRVTFFLLSPFRLGTQLVWSTVMLPRQILRAIMS